MEKTSLQTLLDAPFAAYAYSYPHKTAYRPLGPPVSLRQAWARENRESLYLYLHLPFCEMRCGFCNLFTTVERGQSVHGDYLSALERQAARVSQALAGAKFSRAAIGGGTPTILAPADLHRLFDVASRIFGARLGQIPLSIETSPATATPARLEVLKSRGASRVSIGVQSFLETETRAIGRPQKICEVENALSSIKNFDFEVFNLDLMYGLPAQTPQSWLFSLKRALDFGPQEIYLYPLYVRPLTGLGARADKGWKRENDARLELYRIGRDFLRANGFAQISMRMFQKTSLQRPEGPLYCCQDDGMVGVGCGARSYTRELHYSTEWAVGASGVREILRNYTSRPDRDFEVADFGFELDEGEQKRRFVLQSVLQSEGLDLTAYFKRFGSEVWDDLPQMRELERRDLARQNGDFLRLNDCGMEKSDVFGVWLASARVQNQMEAFAWR